MKSPSNHTYLVENVLLNRSEIVKNAVKNGELYIAKCHLDHSSGVVKLI